MDIRGTGNWYGFRSWEVPAGERFDFEFPAGFEAYWVRLVASRDCEAAAEFAYRFLPEISNISRYAVWTWKSSGWADAR